VRRVAKEGCAAIEANERKRCGEELSKRKARGLCTGCATAEKGREGVGVYTKRFLGAAPTREEGVRVSE
jgi:hypothetical protein